MLRIVENQSAARAQTYYTTSDYYTEGQELVGHWRGQSAERLGLQGIVQPDDWNALCLNRDPTTGERLTPRNREDRRIGYDTNFHVPKSLSVLYAMTEDNQLLEAFRESVHETMLDIESEMQTRVRKGGRNEDRTTGNMVWGEFVHLTSRPVDGLPDPHLHAHCFVFNQTYCDEEQRWKAGQFGSLKRDAPYFEGRFHLRLTGKLQELGLAIKQTPQGWELADISPSLIDKFSRRRNEIEAEAERQGITDPAQKGEIGAKTRSRKQKNLTMPELREEWRARMTDEEQNSLSQVAVSIARSTQPPVRGDAREAVELAADHCFERQSVVPERKLLSEAYRRSVGRGSIQEIDQAYAEQPLIVKERRGQRMVTSPGVLAEEKRMLNFARQGRGARSAFTQEPHVFQRSWLNEGQKRAVEHVLHSHDRVMLIRGAAGVGKTSMMQEAVQAIEASGKQVLTVAPSAKASHGVLREKGFQRADTLARFLADEKLQESVRGQVLWIDEAGLVGTRTMAKVFELAEAKNFRVILSGDIRQHGSVERGAALRLLETEAGLVPVEIKEILRQKDAYKQAVEALSEGRTENGFEHLDRLGWIREVSDEHRYAVLATDYLETIQAGQTALVVSPTHREAETITREIRQGLQLAGRLGEGEKNIPILTNANLTEAERRDTAHYRPDDVLVFHQNAKGVVKGTRQRVGEEVPPVELAARFQVYHAGQLKIAAGERLRITRNGESVDGHRLNNGDIVEIKNFDLAGNLVTTKGWTISREYGFLAHGYVTTSMASQGTDVQKVFIGQSAESFGASSREQFYVSCSRGQQQAIVYTTSKHDLLEAVSKSDERLSATELVQTSSTIRDRDRIARHAWQPEVVREHQPVREVVYER
jgi:conjugative relaxase-like TrwC/TraI family protein